MNTAKQVENLIAELKNEMTTFGLPMSEAAWRTALACEAWAYVFGAWGAECTVSERKKRLSYHPSYTTIKTKCKACDTNNCTGCQWYPDGQRTRCFDCRGFTDWVLKQFGFDLDGEGATSQWNSKKNWCAKGEVSDGIPQGVLVNLFYYKKDDDGKRTATLAHTGLYYNGETVECSSGVQHFTKLNKKWEVWAVAKCFESE